MKALTTIGLTKLIELVKSSFINKTDVETVSEVDLATVATTGSYNDLGDKPTIPTVSVSATGTSTSEVQYITIDGVEKKFAGGGSNGANTNLSNLTSTGQNIANWSSNVTNCITEIPQNIKFELNNGTLTLKAGSKVYKPTGINTFYEESITTDKTFTYPYGAGTWFVFVTPNGAIDIRDAAKIFSGTTEPAQSLNNFWYDTTNNLIKKYYDGAWHSMYSFPIAIITTNASQITSIDQVFNGFGYMGSTIFVLPGVQALIPTGRNSDGTLKNTLLTKQSVNILTPSSSTFSQVTNIALGSSLSYHTFTYDEAKNINSAPSFMNAGDVTWSNGKITYFAPKTVFHAAEYGGMDYVVSFQKPIAANNYTWYRKYKSGWVEQGGSTDPTVGHPTIETISLPVAMANTRYTLCVSHFAVAVGTGGYTGIGWKEKTTTSFKTSGAQGGTGTGNNFDWYVCGMAA